MSSYYDDPDFADEMHRRDEAALDQAITEREALQRQRAALGGTPGICRALSPERTFMCDLDIGHDGDHSGFELPTITLDEDI